jgi:plastocyanin
MKRHSIFFIVIALLLGSCTSNSEKPKLYTVEIKDMKFVPDDIVVKKGDTVRWINQDMMSHDVTEDGKTWASSVIPAGGSWKMEATEFTNYYCSIHMVMKGKIRVE